MERGKSIIKWLGMRHYLTSEHQVKVCELVITIQFVTEELDQCIQPNKAQKLSMGGVNFFNSIDVFTCSLFEDHHSLIFSAIPTLLFYLIST